MALENPSFKASGNIGTSRFVVGMSGSDYIVAQANATSDTVGISQQGTQEAPGTAADSGYAATDGKVVRVYGIGETALLELGGTVSAFDFVGPDANGKGVKVTLTTSGHAYVGAQTFRSGISGDKVPVMVKPIVAAQV